MRRARATLAPTVPTSPPNRAGSPPIAADEDRRSLIVKARRGGRPSRTDALRLRVRILEVATELFLAEGYGSTTIEGVAGRARVSKRTFYHRFSDKAALFAAVVHHIIEQLRPPPGVPLLEGASLHDVLRRLADRRLGSGRQARDAPATSSHRRRLAGAEEGAPPARGGQASQPAARHGTIHRNDRGRRGCCAEPARNGQSPCPTFAS